MSCNNDLSPEEGTGDYREKYVGTYAATKSNVSFEDDMFTTDIEVLVEIDMNNDSILIINGFAIPISEEGTFGPETIDFNRFEIEFSEESIRMATFPIIPGITTYCYIKGTK